MNAAARLVEVRVPDMGNFKDVAVIDVLVKPGESIEPEAPLVTLETEKATMDVPSTASGVIEKIHVAKGGKVSAGDLIATVRSDGAPAEAGGAGARTEAGAPVAGASAGVAAAPTTQAASATPAVTRPASQGPATQPNTTAAAPKAAPAAAVNVGSAPASVGTAPAGGTAPASGGATAGAAAAPVAGSSIPGLRNDLPPINEPGFSRAHAGPSVRKFARELGVDLTRIAGHGFKGRITHEDVKAFVKGFLASGAPAANAAAPAGAAPAAARGPGGAAGAGSALPAIPAVDFSQFGPTEVKPLSRIQKISGPRLHASWVNIPHVTQFDEADITELEETRARLKETATKAGLKLTPLAFIVRACVKALQQFPQFNSSLDPNGANLILKKYIHIGFAADTPNGLVVPVIKDADRKDIYEVARELAALSEKARAGRLSPAEMQGGCFTISSLGGIGGTAFTPIINAPEVAILGVSRSSMKPVYRDGAFVPRLMLPLSLSYDHRVIDGAAAARFTTFLAQTLADGRGLVEAVP
jgi:pyruvate dehydrogenase E2 component (dihydrolipoamide acetyltransferase)